MTIANPVIVTDRYGEEYTFYTDGADVKFTTNLRTTPITAFTQPEEDSPISVTIDPSGKLTVTYLDSDGDPASKSSERDGDSGTWS